MSLNTQGRPTAPAAPAVAGHSDGAGPETFTGNRALAQKDVLIFEKGSEGRSGVDFAPPPEVTDRRGGLARSGPVGLPGLSEPQVVRHYTRLSQQNYAIDAGVFPLGSCTMKHNPRLNERMARLPGFADIHPLQPESTVQGALELMHRLAHWIMTLTGMPAVALSPGAGAHGELTGMAAIRAALEDKGEAGKRRKVLVPEFGARHQSGDGGLSGFHHRKHRGGRTRARRFQGVREASGRRCCRHHADQPQHLRRI